MVSTAEHLKSAERRSAPLVARRYRGEVVYIYAFDVAYEMTRQPVRELLGQPVAQFVVDASKRSPRQLFFYRPQMVRLPPLERIGPHGPVRVERVIKLLPVGAISISVRVPFEVERSRGPGRLSRSAIQQRLAERGSAPAGRRGAARIGAALHPAGAPARRGRSLHGVLHRIAADEPKKARRVSAETWWRANRRAVASLLTQEPDLDHLSKQEADESTGRFLSYYEHDLVVVDWDAALIIDEPQNFDETLYVMELANLQLAELEAYDRILDDSLERAYRDLRSRPTRGRAGMLRELREIRIDLARFSDELSNITKFFGDWHLARIYENISARFHLGDWHRTIDKKLQDAGRSLSTAQPRPDQPLDADPGSDDCAAVRD